MISSDPIERRFGWYRQLSGANYYLSVRQFLESEKKIRIQTLIKFGDLSFTDACEVLKSAQRVEDIEKEAKNLLSLLEFDYGSEHDVEHEEGILFYIAGFLSRAEVKRLKCDSCLSMFVKSKS